MSLDSRLVNLAATGRKLVEHGLVRGAGGSVSLRWQDVCYISPASARLDRLSAADFIALHIASGNTWQLQRASDEHAMHLACYRARTDATTVLNVQAPHCIALGCAGLSIPAITPDFYLAVGVAVPLLPYLAPATQALADAVGQLIADHDAVLLQNQGLVLTASSTDEAFANVLRVEEAAQIVLQAHAAGGKCSVLSAAQIEELETLPGKGRRSRAIP